MFVSNWFIFIPTALLTLRQNEFAVNSKDAAPEAHNKKRDFPRASLPDLPRNFPEYRGSRVGRERIPFVADRDEPTVAAPDGILVARNACPSLSTQVQLAMDLLKARRDVNHALHALQAQRPTAQKLLEPPLLTALAWCFELHSGSELWLRSCIGNGGKSLGSEEAVDASRQR